MLLICREHDCRSVPEAAAVAEVGIRRYESWEAGTRRPKRKHIVRLARWYGLHPSYLFRVLDDSGRNPDVTTGRLLLVAVASAPAWALREVLRAGAPLARRVGGGNR